ncbi:sigma-54-dependent Fis family transcriptional regulator [Algoriphagus aestuariicola]|uniref:Sigma-54-dependent Fis family transcriptional regulator n=1 Tax=Algoriphagus aestuariicola TaxID=1852016 RepID=A0ABS3BQH0_9BACT|nr:sigma-54 dependent transcriptional regulator [Algoriphagus aestuariicola]MBN7801535.1 sigma-54-dependent Fis family transcriptional regulator [Algoriphagus aestuariicola]
MAKILIIEDEKDIRNLLAKTLELEGYQVKTAEKVADGWKKISTEEFNLVLSDVRLPDGSGVELCRKIKLQFPHLEVICMTAFGNIQDGVQAMKNGAFDYLVKGDDNEKLIPSIAKALEKSELVRRISHLEQRLQQQVGFDTILGDSEKIQQAISLAKKVAGTETTVLLTGESGTGKEVFANAIHDASQRKNQPFIAINCSAFGKDLLESELFGYKTGAFTGATKDKKGILEEAHKGTVFLDEIGELAGDLQAKLLRVLETGRFIKVGDTKETQVDIRIVAATNRTLEEEVAHGNFREDLFYRLAVFQITLPSLDSRKADIPILANYFAKTFAQKEGLRDIQLSESYTEALKAHRWKGNIRELRNVIERSVILLEGNTLTVDLLPVQFLNEKSSFYPTSWSLKEVEKTHIEKALAHTGGNKTKTSDLLGIGLTTLYRKLEEYHISPEN